MAKVLLEVGDVIVLHDIAESYKFEVKRVTDTRAYAEEVPLVPGFSVLKEPRQMEFQRVYIHDKVCGWDVYNVFAVPKQQWWLQCHVEQH